MAEHGRRSFWFFLTQILRIERLRPEPHRRMAEEFQEWTTAAPRKTYALWLWPRETLKSTVFTQAGTLWRLVRNPRERVLITNSKLENAELFLRWIKLQFEANAMLRWVYGDLTTDEWYKSSIRIKGADPQAKEASVEIASIDASVVSRHYTLICADDLVDRTRVGTPERVNETILYYKDLQDLLSQGGQMCFVGTRWAEWDLWQYLLDEHTDGDGRVTDPDWHISIHGLEEPDEEGNLRSIFPDPEVGYPPERIARLKVEKGAEYDAQYMNAPRSDSVLALPKPLLFEDLGDLRDRRGLIGYITFDPATSEKASADEAAIVVTFQDEEDHLWVVDARHGRWGPDRTLEELFRAYQEWRPRGVRWVGAETSVAAQRLWLNLIEEKGRQKGVRLPVRELKTGNTADAKRTRILELEPYLAAGKYHVRSDLRGLLEQIEKWPGVRHDDILDAAAYVMQLKRPGSWQRERRMSRTAYRAVSKTGYW